MKCLLIDNYDSYTHILADCLRQCCDEKPVILKNDALSLEEIKYLDFDCIVISPGPGHPDNMADFGVCKELIMHFQEMPILGICLGHQGLGSLFGLSIEQAPKIIHGKSSMIRHRQDPIFRGIPECFRAIRYHSLLLKDDPNNKCVEVIAREADEGLVMGIRIKNTDLYGLQFHPESIGTEYGMQILKNFIGLKKKKTVRPSQTETRSRHFYFEPAAFDHNSEHCFSKLYAKHPYAFWLDSNTKDANSKLSIMGTAAQVFESKGQLSRIHQGGTNTKSFHDQSPFVLMRELLKSRPTTCLDFPYPFVGGWVGYFGYETKAWLGYGKNRRETDETLPDCVMMRADHFLLFDHEKEQIFLCSNCEKESKHKKFVEETQKRLAEKTDATQPIAKINPNEELKICSQFDEETYTDRIKKIFEKLRDGESYEICLSNEFSTRLDVDDFELYRLLRMTNPAPFSAYIKFGDGAVLSSSPERFLKSDKSRRVTSEPIKGTRPKGLNEEENRCIREELLTSEKDRAELLMITDLIRNDLAKISKKGSVEVQTLYKTTDYATVIQLSSIIHATLDENYDVVDALTGLFPGGSITGAPKLRSCQIIDDLENRRRGVYTGTIGYFSYNGCMDFNIAIRTLEKNKSQIRFGSGGAIIIDSDPKAEYEEMHCKARPLIKTLSLAAKNLRTLE